MLSYTVTIQLEYINHLWQFFKNISYYAGAICILLNAFSDLLYIYWQFGIIGWSLYRMLCVMVGFLLQNPTH